MDDISKEVAVQLARDAGFDLNGMQNMLYTVRGNHAQLERLIKLARNQVLEEAKQKCKQLEVAIDGAGNTYYRPADARQCVAAIESLKDNTP